MKKGSMCFGFIDNSIDRGHTIIDNIFLNHFMPNAFSPLYVNVYLDGLMRCFGDKNTHFYSVDAIAKKLNVSSRTIQEIYKYWESIKIYKPDHHAADMNGYVQLIKRVPRFLRVSPGEIMKISNEVNILKARDKLLKKSGKRGLSVEETEELRELKLKLDGILNDYKKEKTDEYKYQSSNAILFLRDFKCFDEEIIKELKKKQMELNSIWKNKKKGKKIKRKKDKEDKEEKKYKKEENEKTEEAVKNKKNKTDLKRKCASSAGEQESTRITSPEQENTPGDAPKDTLINTNRLITTNKSKNQSVNSNKKSVNSNKKIVSNNKNERLDLEYPDRLKDILENAELIAFNKTQSAMLKACIEDMYYSEEYHKIIGFSAPVIRNRLQGLNYRVIIRALDNYYAYSNKTIISVPQKYLAKCIWSAIQQVKIEDSQESSEFEEYKKPIKQRINRYIDSIPYPEGKVIVDFKEKPFGKIVTDLKDNGKTLVYWDVETQRISALPYNEDT